MNKYIVELIATFFLVLTIGLTAVLGLAGDFAPLAIGLCLVVLVYMGGHISGAHYNPAITLGVFIRGRCKGSEVLPYIIAQLVGSGLAALLVANVFAGEVQLNDKAAIISRWVPGATSPIIAAEVLFTFLLVFVVLNVATSKNTANNHYFGMAIGMTVLVGAFAVGSISLGAFNPAVTTGLALMGNMSWADTWMHFLPQALGGILAGFAFKGLYPDDK
jgi:aquaporin Z